MSLTFPLFCLNLSLLFYQFFTRNEKNKDAQRASRKDRELLIEAWINIPRLLDHGRGIPQTLDRGLCNFEFRARHCKQYHVYALCSRKRIVIGAGCTSSKRYPCPVTFPSYDSFLLQNLPGFQHRPRDCAGFSQRSWRVSSERSIGRSRFNWNVLESHWKLQAFRADTVFLQYFCISTVAFSAGHCLELYGCVHAYTGIVTRSV